MSAPSPLIPGDPVSQNDAGAHGRIRLIEPACTSCMLCVRECPVWCITLDSHTEPDPDVAPGARVRLINVLDRFVIDWNLCMYCGICVEECPFDALEWDAHHPGAAAVPADLRHGIVELA
jgi:NADH-quinone oxidoreductase subunit I